LCVKNKIDTSSIPCWRLEKSSMLRKKIKF
jgi:hypothetical protein